MTNPVHDRESLGTALLDAASKAPQNLVSSVMMTIMAEQRQAAPIVRQDRTIRRFWQPIALAAALIFPVAGLGAMQASAAALPGDALYGVRVLREHAALTVAPTTTDRAVLAASFAQDRLDAMHHIVWNHGNLRIALGLMNDAVTYNRDAASTSVSWMHKVLVSEYASAQHDCARLTSDPEWIHMNGTRQDERAMDKGLASFQAVLTAR